MEKKQNVKLTIVIIMIILVVAIAYAISRIVSNEEKISEINNEIKNKNIQIEKLRKEKAELINKKEKMYSDEYIENIAKDKLDMFLPNEQIYMFGN